MRKKVLALLVFAMALTAIPFNVFAEEDYDRQLKEVIVKAKELFNISSEYDKFTHDVGMHGETTVFYLNWSDSKEKLGNVNISITKDGTIISYGKWNPNYKEERTSLPKISKEEGLELAEDFIQKVAPKFKNNIKYIENQGPLSVKADSYNYNFFRIENGTPYYNNQIDISIDNSTGEVRNYYANWDMDLVFQSKNNIISLEKAQELYKEKIGLELLYKLSYEDRKTESFLAYSPLDADLGINAKDGKVMGQYGYNPAYKESSDMVGGTGSDDGAGELNPDEKQAIEDISGLISKEEAEKLARDILQLDLEYKLDYINLYTNWRQDNDYHWEMNFIKEADPKIPYANIRIDAKTRELISFYNYIPVDLDEKAKYNEEQSLKIANEYIKKINPDKFKSLELKKNYEDLKSLEEKQEEPVSYYYEFIRKIDNAYVEQDGITIRVDGVSGRVKEYGLNWSKRDFPPSVNVIEIDKAHDILFENIGMELKYITSQRYGKDTLEKKEATLIYGLKNDKPINIDAKTGTILDYNGKEYKEATIVGYEDIGKSYAENKINILAQYGISFPGQEFRPKEKINQKDFLYLLAKAHAPYFKIDDSKDNLYSYLINIGIIKEGEESPETIVTKEEGIKYIVRALKYDKIADLSQLYKDIFKDTEDINPRLKGYASMAYGLKIVEGYEGYLNPKSELKREDAANIIYNYLFNGDVEARDL